MEINAEGVAEYKSSQGFEKGLAQLSFDFFNFGCELAISRSCFDYARLNLLEDPSAKIPNR